MAVSAGFREYVREQIEMVAPLSMRAMFGGIGLYSNGVFFALIDDDTVFFKVDGRNRPDYEARGMEAFRPFGDERASMQYFELPSEVLEDREELRRWIRGALEAALVKKGARSVSGRKAAKKRREASSGSKRHLVGAKREGRGKSASKRKTSGR